jgi:hypothetical protein
MGRVSRDVGHLSSAHVDEPFYAVTGSTGLVCDIQAPRLKRRHGSDNGRLNEWHNITSR